MAAGCDEFVSWVAPAKDAYQKTHRIHPPPIYIQVFHDYYALPAYIPLVDFAAMGFWRAGDTQLLQQLKSFIGDKNDMHATDWNAMVNFMRKRLATAISNQEGGS